MDLVSFVVIVFDAGDSPIGRKVKLSTYVGNIYKSSPFIISLLPRLVIEEITEERNRCR